MNIFTFHLVKVSVGTTVKTVLFPPKNIPGLIHAEYMTCMTLGSEIYSPSRFLIRQIAVFAQWENEEAIDDFLKNNTLEKKLAKGWHTRLVFLRQWGTLNKIVVPEVVNETDNPEAPVVAVTIARMKLPQVPRFIHWGRPVEKLVRDHPGTSLALAAIRFPQTISTFSVWKSQKEMVEMVRGHSQVPQPKRHAQAMKERERKDFHFQFTTLRFKPFQNMVHGKVAPISFQISTPDDQNILIKKTTLVYLFPQRFNASSLLITKLTLLPLLLS